MTADEFREIALSFPDTEERSHMNHPDFRIGGKIFATLGPDEDLGMAKLTPEQQQDFLSSAPSNFRPAAGKWGEGGATLITLADADVETVGEALTLAWHNTAPKKFL
ncbi:MAG: MmcQ/YjbR family DNA-binding protein [Pyrinomonadaceae bacterium]